MKFFVMTFMLSWAIGPVYASGVGEQAPINIGHLSGAYSNQHAVKAVYDKDALEREEQVGNIMFSREYIFYDNGEKFYEEFASCPSRMAIVEDRLDLQLQLITSLELFSGNQGHVLGYDCVYTKKVDGIEHQFILNKTQDITQEYASAQPKAVESSKRFPVLSRIISNLFGGNSEPPAPSAVRER